MMPELFVIKLCTALILKNAKNTPKMPEMCCPLVKCSEDDASDARQIPQTVQSTEDAVTIVTILVLVGCRGYVYFI